MKIEELVASLRPKTGDKKEEDTAIPASVPLLGPITNPERLIGPVTDPGRLMGGMRPMSICFPHTSNALRDSVTKDMVDGIARRQESVARSFGARVRPTSILMFDPVSGGMQRRILQPDGHLGGVEQ